MLLVRGDGGVMSSLVPVIDPLSFSGPAEDKNSVLKPSPRQRQHAGSTGAEAVELSRPGSRSPPSAPPTSPQAPALLCRQNLSADRSETHAGGGAFPERQRGRENRFSCLHPLHSRRAGTAHMASFPGTMADSCLWLSRL